MTALPKEPLDEWRMALTNFRPDDVGSSFCTRCGRNGGGHAGSKCYPQSAGDLSLDLAPNWKMVIAPDPPPWLEDYVAAKRGEINAKRAIARLQELSGEWRKKGGAGRFSSHHLRAPVTKPPLGSDRAIRSFFKRCVEEGAMREVWDRKGRKTWALSEGD